MEFWSSEKHEIYAWCFVSWIKQEVVSIDGELDNKIAALKGMVFSDGFSQGYWKLSD